MCVCVCVCVCSDQYVNNPFLPSSYHTSTIYQIIIAAIMLTCDEKG